VLTKKEQGLLDALEPRAAAEGIEIVMLEIVGAKKSPTIRVYIDTEDGVSFDELSAAQAWINDIMDQIDPFPGAYMLEVSSPGIDRPLRTLEHFERFAGEQAQVKTTVPIEGRSNFTGTLRGVDGQNVLVECDDRTYSIPLEQVKKANVKGTFDFK
jgi:ribosome maturation factor RimP